MLNLHNNELTGPIPAELGNLTNLRELNVLGTQLTGCIPVGLQDVWGLLVLAPDLPDCG